MGPEIPTTSGGSRPGVSTNPFDVIDENAQQTPVEEPEVTTGFTFETGHWSYVRETPVWRLFHYDTTRVIYRDEQGHYYSTNPIVGLQFSVNHSLIFEELSDKVGRIRDSWNNEYHVLIREELESLRLKGKPIEFSWPASIAQPGMSAYEGKTIAPSMSFNRLNSTRGEPPLRYSPRDPPGVLNPRFRLRPPVAPRLAPFEQNLMTQVLSLSLDKT